MVLIKNKMAEIALNIPALLIPNKNVDMTKWAVIACDQYTSEPDYWNTIVKYVGSSPSSLKMFLPEAYLGTSKEKRSMSSIYREMKHYLRFGILKELEPGFIYTRRTTSYGNIRNGLLACVDLEMYSHEKNSTTIIRPTEKIIMERIPPRVKIREKAPLELPHIMFLIDDPVNTVIEPLEKTKSRYRKLYDFDLMMNGGRIEGYYINDESALSSIANALLALASEDSFHEKYGDDKDVLLYAVGDGNHSLASAKQHWENIKTKNNLTSSDNHPARYALVEIVNIHDAGMKFEPIHRMLFDCPLDSVLDSLKNTFNVTIRNFESVSQLEELVRIEFDNRKSHTFGLVSGDTFCSVTINSPVCTLAVATIQTFLDKFTVENNIEIDFIHDSKSLMSLSESKNTGLLLPPVDKSGFFKTIIEEDTLPRKAFSMGHADEKRFYLESRKIIL